MTLRAPVLVLLAIVGCAGESPAPAHPVAPGSARVSEPFRVEHAHFLARLDATVDEALALSADSDPAEREAHVQAVVAFFEHELVPHAGAEEAVLYDVVDRLAGTPPPLRYTDVLRYEHTVVHAEIRAIEAWAEGEDRSAASIAAFQRRVVGLAGLVRGHFGAEEDVVLALVDARMSRAEFERDVLAPMEAYLRAHGAPHRDHGGSHHGH